MILTLCCDLFPSNRKLFSCCTVCVVTRGKREGGGDWGSHIIVHCRGAEFSKKNYEFDHNRTQKSAIP